MEEPNIKEAYLGFLEEERQMSHECFFCHGVLMSLGVLGDREWYRCRQCGLDQTVGETKGEDDAEQDNG